MWTGESQVVGSRHKGHHLNPTCQTWDPHLVQGHIPDGRAIDFRIRSPTWMEFFTSGSCSLGPLS